MDFARTEAATVRAAAPDRLSVTLARTAPPLEPSRNAGAPAQRTVGRVASMRKPALTGVPVLPCESWAAA